MLVTIVYICMVQYTKNSYFLIKQFGVSEIHGEYISHVPCTLINRCTSQMYDLLNNVCAVQVVQRW